MRYEGYFSDNRVIIISLPKSETVLISYQANVKEKYRDMDIVKIGIKGEQLLPEKSKKVPGKNADTSKKFNTIKMMIK